MVLLIDANIILDVLLNRSEFVKDSSMIWKLCETEQAKGHVSALTFANLVYIMRKQLDSEKIEEVYRKLSLIFEFTDFSVADLTRAAELKWSDFEDAVQSVTAERIHADYIITRNACKQKVKQKLSEICRCREGEKQQHKKAAASASA